MTVSAWRPGSWQEISGFHQHGSVISPELQQTLAQLSRRPPIVLAREALALREALAEVAAGNAFLLQASDCAESLYDWRVEPILNKLRMFLQMALVLCYGAGLPIVKLARVGDYIEPRPLLGATDPHGLADPAIGRSSDPGRLLTAYERSVSAVNAVRALAADGSANPYQADGWHLDFLTDSQCAPALDLVAEITKAVRFMAACGITPSTGGIGDHTAFWTAHGARHLPWEQALTRQDSATGDWWDSSAHLLWIGERSRRPNAPQVEFLRGVLNPVQAKLGPAATPEAVVELCDALNPQRIPGRLTLVCRLGARDVLRRLPPILTAVRDSGHVVAWACDPMHGNSAIHDGQAKRGLSDLLQEVHGYFRAHKLVGTWPGGLSLELGPGYRSAYFGSGAAERPDGCHGPMPQMSQSFGLAFELVQILRSY